MLEKSEIDVQSSLFFSLESTPNHKHPLFISAHKIDWELCEKAFPPLYCSDNGRPAKLIRLMVGLLILKHVRNLSDESVVEQWRENIYYPYFCGQQEFLPVEPCTASELVHFRRRIGEEGFGLILKESIRICGKEGEDKDVYFDMTVQEKNITFPTGDRPAKKIIKKYLKTAESNDLKLRQTYTRTLKKRSYDQRFRNHPQNKGKAGKADKKVKTIAGRLIRDLERESGEKASDYKEVLELSKRVLAQKRNDKDKIYSLHEPEICCINKGKEHKPCEFGNKASFGWTASGVIVSALVFRNEYDGHTLDKYIEQVGRLRESPPENGIGDRGYRGRGKVGETVIHIPKPFSKKLSVYMQRKEKKYFRKRAGIEPVISHLKAGRRLSRNFYKGIFGDNINMMLAATGFNFKRMMNKWKASFLSFGRCCFKK